MKTGFFVSATYQFLPSKSLLTKPSLKRNPAYNLTKISPGVDNHQVENLFFHLILPVIIFYYFLAFAASLLVDVIPLIGPPAWTVMLLCQASFHLDIWWVLVVGVTGSAIGRFIYASYIHLLSDRLIKPQKAIDLQFLGSKLAGNGWRIQLFVFIYTLMPLPSVSLFTAAGIARIKPLHIIPAFFVGKFISDAAMVFTGSYMLKNIKTIGQGLLSLKSLVGMVLSLLLIFLFLFIDWKKLLVDKKFRISFRIWK